MLPQGDDSAHSSMSTRDGTLSMSYQQKFEPICELTLFECELNSQTSEVPRLLRTTACIRKE